MEIYIDIEHVNTFRYLMSKPELRDDMLRVNTADCDWRVLSYIKGFDNGYIDELAKTYKLDIDQKFGKAYQAGYAAGRADARSLISNI